MSGAVADVVAELDRYLADDETIGVTAMVQRARDEIVALRDTVERQKLVLSKGHAETRAEALEEAAQMCDTHLIDGSENVIWSASCRACAAAIRALKEVAR